MKRDGVGVRDRIYTRQRITRYLKDNGIRAYRVRKQEEIHPLISKYHSQGLTPEAIANRLNQDGVKPLIKDCFTEGNVRCILNQIRRQSKTGERRGPKNWDLILQSIKEGLTTNEIVVRLNAKGLTTETALP
jgi:hypothetical protein